MYKTGPRKWEWADVIRVPLSLIAITSWLWVLWLIPPSLLPGGSASDGMSPIQGIALIVCFSLLVVVDKGLTKLTRRFKA